MIVSNTNGLTRLLLAKLVDEGRIGCKHPVTKIMPGFRLGDEVTTKEVLFEHLVYASIERRPRMADRAGFLFDFRTWRAPPR